MIQETYSTIIWEKLCTMWVDYRSADAPSKNSEGRKNKNKDW